MGRKQLLWLIAVGILLVAGLTVELRWFDATQTGHWYCADCMTFDLSNLPPATPVDELKQGAIATMDSPIFTYTPADRWRVDAQGADPGEPDDPWAEPSGVVDFTYQGQELALLVAVGNYWGYMTVTIDGQPANLLSQRLGSVNQEGLPGGSKNFHEPERTPLEDPKIAVPPIPRWVRVHRAESPPGTVHRARIEIWRSWGQTPLRGVAVDGLPSEPPPAWPGLLLLLAGGWLFWLHPTRAAMQAKVWRWVWQLPLLASGRSFLQGWPVAWMAQPAGYWSLAGLGALSIVCGISLGSWIFTLLGVGILALTALFSLLPWGAMLLFGLPFYYGVKLPLLPGRAVEILNVGLLGGLLLLLLHRLLSTRMNRAAPPIRSPFGFRVMLALLISWALVATAGATYGDLAFREWRTLFLAAGLLILLLDGALFSSANPSRDRHILLYAWLAGGTLMALIGLWHFVSGSMLITAEGVFRIRGLYGSPNNLALYLERILGVTLAMGLFLQAGKWRWIGWAVAGIQMAALLLTFSKGALFLGLPALFLTLLWVGFYRVSPNRPAPGRTMPTLSALGLDAPAAKRRLLMGVGALGLFCLLMLIPFLGTERFQRLFDFRQGTSFLRLQLWRGSLQMALDHPWLGVGPDNFLYAYRSTYLLPAAWEEPSLNHPHNWILDWWTRLGLPGLALGLLFWGRGLVGLWQKVRAGHNFALTAGLLAAASAALAHGFIDASYALPDLMLVWVLIFWFGEAADDEQVDER